MATATVAPRSTWTAARRKRDGKPFFYVPGSQPGTVYMTATDGCTCPAAQHSRTGDCKHQMAVRQARPAVREVRGRYAEIFGVCDVTGCDEDRARGENYCDRHVLVDCF